MTTETALTLPERASVALGSKDYELKLAELVKSSVRIVEIKNGDAYKEAHGARMSLKNTRVAIEKAGKAAREDATAFSKAVIAEEKRLIEMIDPEEKRLQVLQDEWDADREAERQAKLQAEQARIDEHRETLDWIRTYPVRAAQLPSDVVQSVIDSLAGLDVSADVFEEFAPAADKAKSETLATLRTMHADALAREAEAARLEAERIERERQQAEEAARLAAEQKAEADRLAAERRKFEEDQRALRAAQAEADRQAAEARAAEQARLDAERAEVRRQQDAIAAELRRQQDEHAAAVRAEADRIAAERRAADERLLAAERAERDAAEAARREAAEKTNGIRQRIDAYLYHMADDELTQVLNFIIENGLHMEIAA